MATITNWEMRLILDRNQNALEGRPTFDAGSSVAPGLYWDPVARLVVPIQSQQTTDRHLVSVHPNPGATMDDVVGEVAMGGGGRSGRPVPYDEARRSESHQHRAGP